MPAKVSLSWLGVIFLAVLTGIWLGIWAAVERWRADDDRRLEPREDVILLRHLVPTMQARLAAAQGELAALQARHLEQRSAITSAELSRKALEAAYPQWQALGVPKGDKGPDPRWLAVRPETLQAFLQARAELDLASRRLKALETDHTSLIELRADLETAQVDANKKPRDASLQQSRLAACNEQLEAARKKLAEARVELATRQAQVDALSAASPRLASLPSDTSPLFELPPEAVAAFLAARAQRASAETTADSLQVAITGQLAAVARANGQLISAQREAGAELEEMHDRWDLARRAKILAWALPISVLVLVVAVAAFWKATGASIKGPSWLLLAGAAVATLVVVDAFQVFQMIGASVVAAVFVLVAGAWLVRRV